MPRRTTWRARKTLRLGPAQAHYFRRYSASATTAQATGGFTSHGFKLGRLTVNLTRRTWTFDTPGPGSATGDLPAWLGGRQR